MILLKRILVTGGAGFIGSHLCEYLLKEGNIVLSMDNFVTGSQNNINNINNTRFISNFQDITVPFNHKVDEIYNLACPASPVAYQKDPIQTIKTCSYGVINVLNNAKSYNIPVLQASTSEVYGDPLVHPQQENYWGNVNPIGIRSCYDEGKRCAETLFFDYHRINNVDIKVARIFNTYGPRMQINDGRVVSNFICQAINDEDITIYGNGKQTRCFCYIDDMVLGLVSLMNTKNFTGPVNLGSTQELSIYNLAKIIIRLTRSDSKIKYEKLPQDDPKERRPDIRLAKEKLNWEPKVGLEDGLKKTIEYFREVL